jgi:hypothetical protein
MQNTCDRLNESLWSRCWKRLNDFGSQFVFRLMVFFSRPDSLRPARALTIRFLPSRTMQDAKAEEWINSLPQDALTPEEQARWHRNLTHVSDGRGRPFKRAASNIDAANVSQLSFRSSGRASGLVFLPGWPRNSLCLGGHPG